MEVGAWLFVTLAVFGRSPDENIMLEWWTPKASLTIKINIIMLHLKERHWETGEVQKRSNDGRKKNDRALDRENFETQRCKINRNSRTKND